MVPRRRTVSSAPAAESIPRQEADVNLCSTSSLHPLAREVLHYVRMKDDAARAAYLCPQTFHDLRRLRWGLTHPAIEGMRYRMQLPQTGLAHALASGGDRARHLLGRIITRQVV